jgi:hypothetical protein
VTDETMPCREPLTGFWFRSLERLTAGVLLTVLAALGWMMLAVYRPGWGCWLSTEVEVLIVLALLVVALVLVSVVALLHTRADHPRKD